MYTQDEMDAALKDRDVAQKERDAALRLAETAVHNAITILGDHWCDLSDGFACSSATVFCNTIMPLVAQADWLHLRQGHHSQGAAPGALDHTRCQEHFKSCSLLCSTAVCCYDSAAVDSDWLSLTQSPRAVNLCALVLKLNFKLACLLCKQYARASNLATLPCSPCSNALGNPTHIHAYSSAASSSKRSTVHCLLYQRVLCSSRDLQYSRILIKTAH